MLTVTAEQPLEVNVLTLPEVSIGNELTIASLPAVEVSGLVSVTLPDVLTVTAERPLEVNVLTLPEVSIGNELTIASLPAVEVSGLVSVTLPDVLTVTAEQPLEVNVLTLPEVSIGNELTIASLPAVEVSGLVSVTLPDVLTLPEVSIGNELTIASLPAVEVSGLVSVTLPEVLTVTAEQPLDVNVLTLPEVSIGNELTIASLPAIEISGTPTVLIDQPIEVTTGTTNLAVQLAARTVTNDIQSYTLNSTSTITTPVYYVGELRDFGYLMFSTAQDVTAIAYASPLPSGIPAISLAGPVALSPTQVVLPAGYATGGYIANVEYSHYSYVALEVSTSTDVTVDIYFQGQI
ncbi:hypothetical protein [Turicibacter sp. H121]|uniref:hypothetical protein n=1 Tax=Turicibacter sp. H121 TaxID=1712675 RepID=UPI000762EF48|nr:hypothetical protein [Turicibacter sp. H121]AMC07540.1 hypothetical protein AT726_00075 [Turicibacter sp. H121]